MVGMMQNEQFELSVPWHVAEYIDVAARAREARLPYPSRLSYCQVTSPHAASAADFLFHGGRASSAHRMAKRGLVDTGPYRMSSPISADAPSILDARRSRLRVSFERRSAPCSRNGARSCTRSALSLSPPRMTSQLRECEGEARFKRRG